MAQQSPRQRRAAGRVMHEFKHGELKSGPEGKAGKVKSRKQAIAIALSEAGESRSQSQRENSRSERKTEAQGRTAQRRSEGKGRGDAGGPTRQELYARAQRRRIAGRSRMSKAELQSALGM